MFARLAELVVWHRRWLAGVLVASALWLATMMPTGALIYRPDAFDGRPGLAELSTLPSVIWHDATSAWLGPIAVVVAVPIVAALVAIAGKAMESADAR